MKNVFIVGDVHGRFNDLITRIKEVDLKECVLICVGDLGVGFQQTEKKEFSRLSFLNDFFERRNIDFLSIRGNHDDPKWFKNDYYKDSNIELLKNYTYRKINDDDFLFVGGAISIDRVGRINGRSYWEDENFILDESKIKKCDVLITHSAPSWNGPFDKAGIQYWCDKDPLLWEECVKERKDHDKLIKLSEPEKHFCGHFHEYWSVEFDGCYSRILAELEIVECG